MWWKPGNFLATFHEALIFRSHKADSTENWFSYLIVRVTKLQGRLNVRFKGKGTSCAKSRALLKREWDPESWDGDIWEVERENFEPPVSLVATGQKHPFPFAGGDQPPFVWWPCKDLIRSRCLTRWFFSSSRTLPVSPLYLQNNWD